MDGRWFVAASAAVTTRAVAASADQHDCDNQEDQDGHNDPKHLHPAWQAGPLAGGGIVAPVSHLRLLPPANRDREVLMAER